MRRTVTLDPDVVASLQRLMKEKGLSFKAALNQALREGLLRSFPPAARTYQQKTFRMGLPSGASLDGATGLASALEDDEILRKLDARN